MEKYWTLLTLNVFASFLVVESNRPPASMSYVVRTTLSLLEAIIWLSEIRVASATSVLFYNNKNIRRGAKV